MRYVLLGVICLGLVVGCARKWISDEEAIRELIDELGYLLGAGEYYGKETGDTTVTQGKGYAGVFWYRSVDSVSVDLKVNINGDSAWVEIERMIYGVFHRFPFDTMPAGTLVDKPKDLKDKITRYAIFRKTGKPRRHRGWCLHKLSGAMAKSQLGGPDIKIDSVKLILKGDTITIREPFEFTDTVNIIECQQNEEIEVYAYVSPDTVPVLVFLHSPGNQRHIRRRCMIISDGVFYGECKVGRKGYGRLGVDVIWSPSLFEDDEGTYPYCSRAWIINIRCK